MDNADKIENTEKAEENTASVPAKVSEVTHKEMALFLGDDLKTFNNGIVKPYNLEEEYAKTARHKSKMVWLILILCFIFVGICTTVTTALVSSANEKISVKIDTFNDLNLRQLLSMVNRSQVNYENAIKQKQSLLEELENEIEMAEAKKENDLYTIKSISIFTKKSKIAERQKQIEEEYTASVNDAHARYDDLIKKAESEIELYKKQIDSYDQDMLAQAKVAESSIDSQKQLNDIQRKNESSKNDEKLKKLRLKLIEQQIRAGEEQKKAVEEVKQAYQAEIVELMKSHTDFLEKLISHNGGNGLIIDCSNEKSIQVYISQKSLKLASSPETTALLSTNSREYTISKAQDEKFFILTPVPEPAVPEQTQLPAAQSKKIPDVPLYAGDTVTLINRDQ